MTTIGRVCQGLWQGLKMQAPDYERLCQGWQGWQGFSRHTCVRASAKTVSYPAIYGRDSNGAIFGRFKSLPQPWQTLADPAIGAL